MTGSEAMAITCGLGSALSWGAGDFSGGFAAKRGNVYTVILFSQIVGFLLLFALAVLFAETMPGGRQLMWGGLAGISGALGLIALYSSLARSRMGIVAPISAVATAMVPVAFASATDGLPKTSRIIGFCIALFAVWLLSYSQGDTKARFREFYLPAAAGFGFAGFFIFIDKASADAIFWPLVAARFASVAAIVALSFTGRGRVEVPAKRQLLIICLAGVLDVAGNSFFVLSAQFGRLDLSAVLASLYPAATVMLAWFILKERLFPRQWIGVMAALLSLVLISM